MRWSECFYFRQKTAYEMRISDGSSDVCSSDLRDRLGLLGHPWPVARRVGVAAAGAAARPGAGLRVGRPVGVDDHRRAGGASEGYRRPRLQGGEDAHRKARHRRGRRARGERKSGVEGKSEAVSVERGGRRNTKKTKQKYELTDENAS